MNQSDTESVERLLIAMDVLRKDGHFISPGYLHYSTYVSEELLYPDVGRLFLVASFIAREFCQLNIRVVMSEADETYALAQAVAYHLSNNGNGPVYAVCATRDVRYNYTLLAAHQSVLANRPVLVVDGYAENAKCLKRLALEARQYGTRTEVVGAAAVLAGSNLNAESFDLPQVTFLARVSQQTYRKGHCPLCTDHKPIDMTVGRGAEYVKQHGQP